MKRVLSNLCAVANNRLLPFLFIIIIGAGACQKTGVVSKAVTDNNASIAENARIAACNTFHVSNNSQLDTAMSSAVCGSTIVLADGTYAGFTVTKNGITIQAANKGSAIVSSGIIHLSKVARVTIQGLNITTAGSKQTVDGESFPVAVWFEASDSCRLAGCTLTLSGQASNTQWVMLSGNSNYNRIDHNEFGPNSTKGHYIFVRGNRTGITVPKDRTDWANGNGPVNPNMARHTRIDHNYFHDMAASVGEIMVLGGIGVAGDYQHTYTTVESNLFVNCDGDAEIISIKSSNNTIRANTIRTSIGTISCRAGNSNTVCGNLMLQEGKTGTSGIKIYEKNHTVIGNYIDNPQDYGFILGAGDNYDSADFSHAQVFNAHVIGNIFINMNTRGVIIGHGSNDLLPPTDCVFANNALRGTASTLLNLRLPGNTVFFNNTISGPNPPMPSTPLTTSNTGPGSYCY